MILMNHGIFSFGATAKESYERMIDLVNCAEQYLDAHKAWQITMPDPAPLEESIKQRIEGAPRDSRLPAAE